MIVNNRTKLKLLSENFDNIYVVADFDGTITTGGSKTSWSILEKSEYTTKEYKEDAQTLFETYRPIELDESLDVETKCAKMEEWYKASIGLFVKHGIKEKICNDASTLKDVMEFREGAEEFLKMLYEKHIPLIIISAGIGNFIEKFLKNYDCYYENICVISNRIIFKDGLAVGVGDDIIHSLNKNEVALPESVKPMLSSRENVILLADQLSDLNMVSEIEHANVLKVGFLSKETENLKDAFKEKFDIVLEENENYLELLNILKKEEIK